MVVVVVEETEAHLTRFSRTSLQPFLRPRSLWIRRMIRTQSSFGISMCQICEAV